MHTRSIPLLASAALLPPVAHAQLIGTTITASREIPSISFVFGPVNQVVQAGPGDTFALSTGNNIFVNPEASSIEIAFGAGSTGPFALNEHYMLFQNL